jgi:hypothetical protein
MRKPVAVFLLVLILCAAYAAWPFLSLFRLAQAVESRDLPAIGSQVDFPAVRKSLTEQIMATYARLTGVKLSPLTQALVLGTVSSIADPIVEKLTTPEAFTDLLRNGWPGRVLPDGPHSTPGLSRATLGNAWQLFVNSDYGVGRFSITTPADRPEPQRFRLGLLLKQWHWKLAAVRLPAEIQERIAQELIRGAK